MVVAFGPFLQHDYDPSQILRTHTLRPPLQAPSLPANHLQLNGLPRYRRSVDEPERLSLLHSSPRLLESIGRGSRLKLSTCQPCLVHQCGTPDFYRSGNIGSAPVAIMEVTATEKTEVGDPGGFRSWNLVSRSNIVCG